ncbi:IclR family transcriptional regulator [Kiloniella sp.]|uniref:IclR family transcriptional regulator n=1 Tax=Kiloniella sp. TaxID=1938587 RepID=UPI003B0279A7
MDVNNQSQAGVGLLAKAFQLLDLFQIDQPNWSQAELIEQTGMSRSTASRLVRYMVDKGYLALMPGTGRYSLGVAAINLGERAKAGFDLKGYCQPAMEALSQITSETIVLTAYDPVNKVAICIDQIESAKGGLRVFEKIGATFPLHAGAAPRAILALLPENEQQAYLEGKLEKFTPNTLTTPKEIREDLQKIKSKGFCHSQEETYLGAAGMAAAFWGGGGYPLGSIAIAYPLQNMDEADQVRIGDEMAKIANELSATLKSS